MKAITITLLSACVILAGISVGAQGAHVIWLSVAWSRYLQLKEACTALHCHCVAFCCAFGTNHVAAKITAPTSCLPRTPSTCRLHHVHRYHVYTGSVMPAGSGGEFVAVLAFLLGLLLADSAPDALPGGNAGTLAQCICAALPPVCAAAASQSPELQAGRCGSLLTGGFCAKTCGFCQCPAGEISPAAAPGPSEPTSSSFALPLPPHPAWGSAASRHTHS